MFIKHQLFHFLNLNQKVYIHFKSRAEQALRSSLRYLWIQKIFYKFLFPKIVNKKYLFYGLKYQDLIQKLPQEVLLLGGGKTLWNFSRRTKIPALFVYPFFKTLLPFFNDESLPDTPLIKDVDRLSSLLMSTGGKYLIIETDSLPPQRLLILAARKASIKSICILHGVSTYSCVGSLSDGQFADYMLVYDDYQKDVLIHAGINPKKLFILGYYTSLPNHNSVLKYNRQTICILGQPWIHYDVAIFKRYQENLLWIIDVLTREGLSIVYKPHPGEYDYQFIHDFSKAIKINTDNITSCLESYDVFISFASTAILEATLHAKIAIQIYDGNMYDDRFEDALYSYTVNSGDSEALCNHIHNSLPLSTSPIIHYSQLPINERFVQTLNIIKSTNSSQGLLNTKMLD